MNDTQAGGREEDMFSVGSSVKINFSHNGIVPLWAQTFFANRHTTYVVHKNGQRIPIKKVSFLRLVWDKHLIRVEEDCTDDGSLKNETRYGFVDH